MSTISEQRLAIIKKWLVIGYELHPPVDLIKAIESEKLKHEAILEANQDEHLLIHCVKTGKPIGKLFESCVDVHLNHGIAPNWLNTSAETIKEKLESEPIALLVYTVFKLAFKSSKEFENYVKDCWQIESSIELTATAHRIKSEVYNTLSAVLSATDLARLIVLVTETGEFAKYHNHISVMLLPLVDLLCGRTSYEVPLPIAINTAMANAYLPHLAGYLSRAVIDELMEVSENDYITNLDTFAQSASNRLSAPSYELTSSKLVLFSMQNRKLMTREQVETLTDVTIAFSSFLQDTLADDEINPYKMGFTIQATKTNPVPRAVTPTTTASEHLSIIQNILGINR
jgi:hypothetical protein